MFDLFRNYTRTEKRELMEKREQIRKELGEEWDRVCKEAGLP